MRLSTTALLALTPAVASATSLFRFENRRENGHSWRILPETSLLSTKDNYDASGSKVVVPGLNSYKKTSFDLTAVYGVTRSLSVFGRVSFASVSFETTSLTGSGSGLTEQGVGANYRVWESAPIRLADGSVKRTSALDAQLQLDFPLYDNVSSRASNPRQPLRGDGTFDLTLAGFGTMPINQGVGTRLFLIGGVGLTTRNNNYSKAIPYQLQIVGLPEKSGLLYRAGLHGFKSMTTDAGSSSTLSPQAQSTPGVLDPQDAGRSLVVDALNSTYMTFRATLGYQWGAGDQVYATYVMPLSGTSTAALTGILVGAQFRFSGGNTSNSAAQKSAASARLSYDLEGHVKQANDRLNLIKIDLGESDGIDKGNTIDIYRVSGDGVASDLIARGIVTSVSGNESVVNLRQYKKEVWVQTGFIARRVAVKKNP